MTRPTPAVRPVLGVAASLRGRPWTPRLDAGGEARALAIAQLGGHGDILARVLAARGVAPDAAAAYLDPTLRALMPDPAVLVDLDNAVAQLADAVAAGMKIAIFGDYDVDGACAAALLADYLAACGTPHVIHIPDRIFEGYGPNVDAVRALHAAGARRLVTVDCGTTSHAALAEAAALGLDPIVLDHHQAPERLPDGVVVNPNRLDDLSGLGQLCAAGVVFMVLVALGRELRRRDWFVTRPEPDLLAALDLVALATVADVAPLTGLNRAFVVKGLAVMRARHRPGLAALFDVAGADGPATTYQLGYLVGPRINAGGRVGDAGLGARLLTLVDADEAAILAAQLDRLNRERRAIEAATLEQAEAEALAAVGLHDDGAAVIVVGGTGWHQGIVGIIAGRLRETFGRPAFVVSLDGAGGGTGSGRSVPGVDLGSSVRAAVEAGILAKGGGHAMAAGITLGSEGLAAFRTFVEADLGARSAAARAADSLAVDAVLAAAGATPALLGELARAGPFGAGSPEPVFAFAAHRLVDVAVVGTDHVRLRAQAGDGAVLEGIAFRTATSEFGRTLIAARGARLHLAGTLSLDRYGGRERVRLRLLDAARA